MVRVHGRIVTLIREAKINGKVFCNSLHKLNDRLAELVLPLELREVTPSSITAAFQDLWVVVVARSQYIQSKSRIKSSHLARKTLRRKIKSCDTNIQKRIDTINSQLAQRDDSAINASMVQDPDSIWWSTALSDEFRAHNQALATFSADQTSSHPLHLKLKIRLASRKLLRLFSLVRGAYEEQQIVPEEAARAFSYLRDRQLMASTQYDDLESQQSSRLHEMTRLGRRSMLAHNFARWRHLEECLTEVFPGQ
jgi:hypothetical protein